MNLTKHLSSFMELRDRRRRLDLYDRCGVWLDSLLDPQSWAAPRDPRDPHDAPVRKWFRYFLVMFCVVSFVLVMLPQTWRDHRRTQPPSLVREVCSSTKVTKFRLEDGQVIWPTTWYDCTQYFSDGTYFHRVGDVKP